MATEGETEKTVMCGEYGDGAVSAVFCFDHHANYNKLIKTVENDRCLVYNGYWLFVQILNRLRGLQNGR